MKTIESGANAKDSNVPLARPANGSSEPNSSEAETKLYEEVVTELESSASDEPISLPPVRKAVRSREHFIANTLSSREVQILRPLSGGSAEISLKRTSKSQSEGASIGIKEIGRAFGNAVYDLLADKTQVQFSLSGGGKSLIGYVLRGKTFRVYVPLKYCAGIVVPELGFVQPVLVTRLIIG